MQKSNVNRRDFLKTTAAGAAAMSLTAASYAKVLGANERIGVAFLGVGGRCQAHLGIIDKLSKENKGVAPVAVCDVWDGYEKRGMVTRNGKQEERITYQQGLFPSAKRVGLDPNDKKHVVKDFRRLLELPEVDVVCIATPDHWHARMSIDAAAAGKHVYCEKPMTRTIQESQDVVDAMKKYNRVMSVGVQSMADPRWQMANERIRKGDIGHVAQAQTQYYRNGDVGQWRYYQLHREMNPRTIDWKMFLGTEFGLAPDMPFDRAIFAQWRCYWPFGGGMFTDLFVHQTTHLIAAMGVRYPSRVIGGGGIYLEYDERDVPDVATVVADYDEGCQVIITATMINDYPIEEVIRGHMATIRFVKDGFEILPQNVRSGPGVPKKLEDMKGEYVDCHPPKGPDGDTEALWMNFLQCVRENKRETLSPPELGAAAFTTVNMGVLSYREGKVLFWDKERRKPVEADNSWARKWEERSKKHGKPNQVTGWQGGDKGSLLHPPDYQKLAGAWKDGQDPAENVKLGS
jgi:predicted dehydrogenase